MTRRKTWLFGILLTGRGTLLAYGWFLTENFGIFPCKVKNIISPKVMCTPGEVEPIQGENELNIGRLRKLRKNKKAILGRGDVWQPCRSFEIFLSLDLDLIFF